MNKITILLFCTLVLISKPLLAKDKPAYAIFTAEGKEVDFDKMMNEISKKQVIFFGELHNNPISHWLELEVTIQLFENKKQDLVLSAEMFEADDQLVINEYLKGKISEKTLNTEAKLWANYKTDYKPLLEFAKTNNLPFICANIPRRYANLVYNKGIAALDSLNDEAKKYIAPLPILYNGELTCYKEIVANTVGHSGENLPISQAIKDATMAWFISKYLTFKAQIIHYNGSYHSDRGEGTIWYLKQYSPSVTITNITTKEQIDIKKLDDINLQTADYIIVVPENMTKTN